MSLFDSRLLLFSFSKLTMLLRKPIRKPLSSEELIREVEDDSDDSPIRNLAGYSKRNVESIFKKRIEYIFRVLLIVQT